MLSCMPARAPPFIGLGEVLKPLSCPFAGLPLSVSEKLFRCHEVERLLGLLGKLALGGVLAFGLGFSEFLLVSRTSSLALSISGIFKVFGQISGCLLARAPQQAHWGLTSGARRGVVPLLDTSLPVRPLSLTALLLCVFPGSLYSAAGHAPRGRPPESGELVGLWGVSPGDLSACHAEGPRCQR